MIAKRLTPAAAYIRMSGNKQDRSPDRQRGILKRLAEREGCKIVVEYLDEAKPGDSGPELRDGFRQMIEAAERGGLFKVVLAENMDRLSRRNSVKGLQLVDRIIDFGVRVITDADGEIDLDSFEGRVVAGIRQEGKHSWLVDHASRVATAQADNAVAGFSNGGPPKYALDRALVGPDGSVARILQPGESVRIKGHRVKLIPTTDTDKLAAVRFAFKRFATSDIGYRTLAHEMNAKGFSAPGRGGWGAGTVAAMLKNPAYTGVARWGAKTAAKYVDVRGGAVAKLKRPVMSKTFKPIVRDKQPEDAISKPEAFQGIVPRKIFDKVQRKIARRAMGARRGRACYPLAGLIFCRHCGQPMHGTTEVRKDRSGKDAFRYVRYRCSTYSKYGPAPTPHNKTCLHHAIDAERVEAVLARKLQEAFLGPGRDALVKAIKRRLKAEQKGGGAAAKRLEKRLVELDKAVENLTTALRTAPNVPELVRELQAVTLEREDVRAELGHVGRHTGDIDAQAEATADKVWRLAEALKKAKGPELRELYRLAFSRIECEWTAESGRPVLKGGKGLLRPGGLFSLSNGYAEA